jgi:hypothetical protein
MEKMKIAALYLRRQSVVGKYDPDMCTNVRFWHKTNIRTRSINARFWG